MAEKWRPVSLILREAALYQRRVADQIASARPPTEGGVTGGTLAAKARSPSLLAEKAWGAVVQWATLGQKFLWFVEGTKTGGRRVRLRGKADVKGNRSQKRVGGTYRQKPRQVSFAFDAERLARALEENAAAFYGGADAASGGE